MRKTDVAIVGAGLAGSLAATMLGRAGNAVTLIDPFDSCRPDFRCEKLEKAHVQTLRNARVLDARAPCGASLSGHLGRAAWTARGGQAYRGIRHRIWRAGESPARPRIEQRRIRAEQGRGHFSG